MEYADWLFLGFGLLMLFVGFVGGFVQCRWFYRREAVRQYGLETAKRIFGDLLHWEHWNELP